MKKITKVLSMIMLMTIAIMSISSVVLAYVDVPDINPTKPTGKEWTDLVAKILGVVQFVGYGVAIITLTLVGIKYMIGSPAEKAEYKKTLIPYFVGAIILFAASIIVTAIKGLLG